MCLLRLRTVEFMALVSMILFLVTAGPAIAQKGKGGGGGGGKGDDGGSDSGGPMPSGLTTRYLVQHIPLPVNRDLEAYTATADVNESCVSVGYYVDEAGYYLGYRFDGTTGVMQTSLEMLDLSATGITDIAFIGVNNFDAIVGYAGLDDGTVIGIIVTPNDNGGWSLTEVEPPYPGCDFYYARKINDLGDIAGEYVDASGNTASYAFNPGIYSTEGLNLYLAPTDMGAFGRCNGVSNTGLAVAGSPTSVVFDFNAARQGLSATTTLPQENGLSFQSWISNDGQVAANRSVTKGKEKGDYVEVYQDGLSLTYGPIKLPLRALKVNSRTGSNPVGDILLRNFEGGLWLQHADWGLIGLDDMVVFDDPATELDWFAAGALEYQMSDRFSSDFPCLTVRVLDEHFLLVPIEP